MDGLADERMVGYLAVSDPGGFALVVPEGFTRSQDDKRVYYMAPDQDIRIGIRVQSQAADGPLGSMRRSDADGANTHPGYRDGKVTATVQAHGKSGKVPLVKCRPRKHYLRQGTHRQPYTEVRITGILGA